MMIWQFLTLQKKVEISDFLGLSFWQLRRETATPDIFKMMKEHDFPNFFPCAKKMLPGNSEYKMKVWWYVMDARGIIQRYWILCDEGHCSNIHEGMRRIRQKTCKTTITTVSTSYSRKAVDMLLKKSKLFPSCKYLFISIFIRL